MYLSKLVLNRRHSKVRRDVDNPYEMHATLAWLFEDPKAARPLWRLENLNPPTILLQSVVAPDFPRLENRNGYMGYFKETPKSKTFKPLDWLSVGQILRFRLEANATVTRQGKRHGLHHVEEQLSWLQRQSEKSGFKVLGATVNQSERRSFRKRGVEKVIVLMVVRFDGYLRVIEPQSFASTIQRGIGHGKGLGCGLLSVAPAR